MPEPFKLDRLRGMDAARLKRTVSDLGSGTVADFYYARTISVQLVLRGTTKASFVIKFSLMTER